MVPLNSVYSARFAGFDNGAGLDRSIEIKSLHLSPVVHGELFTTYIQPYIYLTERSVDPWFRYNKTTPENLWIIIYGDQFFELGNGKMKKYFFLSLKYFRELSTSLIGQLLHFFAKFLIAGDKLLIWVFDFTGMHVPVMTHKLWVTKTVLNCLNFELTGRFRIFIILITTPIITP